MTKQKKQGWRDPDAEREAKKYADPIPSRELILQYLNEVKTASLKQICSGLRISDKVQIRALERRMRAMVRDGQAKLNKRKQYQPLKARDLSPGRVEAHAGGYGFFIPEERTGDLYLSPREMMRVLHDDQVLVREIPGVNHKRMREAKIVEITKRRIKKLVGRVEMRHGYLYLKADDKRVFQDIVITVPDTLTVNVGQIVVAEIITDLNDEGDFIAQVKEVLGEHMAPGMEIATAIRAHNLPHEWPQPALNEIKHLKPQLIDKDYEQRKDLRDLSLVTIDGIDAKDFDDAVHAVPLANGEWRLYVAIADVSYYVQPHTALDEAAQERGNSVYFPGNVIPMLPEILSNELCSLRPNVDRLCMVCEAHLNKKAEIINYQFYPAVMHSKARLTYDEVAIMIETKQAANPDHQPLIPAILNLYKLFQILHEQRQKRGAIDFDTTETQIIFNEERKIEKIVARQRNDAHRLIEECMLLANVAAADLLMKYDEIPALYRVHAGPSSTKLIELRAFLAELGLKLGGRNEPKTNHYAKLLAEIAERPDRHLIQTMLLRSLSQAVYQPLNIGHFGLAYEAYTHFTSPIRRYPDLIVHRAIKHIIKRQKPTTFPYDLEKMQMLGEHCSTTERRADDATRDVTAWLKCEFMLEHVGSEFSGIITSVTQFGLFIELADIYIEGLLHITQLQGDYYQFDAVHQQLRGERTGKRYRLGDSIQVLVARVSLDDRKIDFALAEK